MFVLLQNVASGMGCLLKPVFYKQIKSINPMVLVIFTKISAFCAVCVHNGYLHFTRRQSNLSTVRNLGDLQWKLVPGMGNYKSNLLVNPTSDGFGEIGGYN